MRHLQSTTTLVWLALMGVSAPALAQDTDMGPSTNETDRGGGFDTGWLGLIGLFGLIGLKRKSPEHDRSYAGGPAVARG